MSINIGISPKPLQLVDVTMNSRITPVKPIDSFCSRWDVLLNSYKNKSLENNNNSNKNNNGTQISNSKALVTIVIVGGGAGGAELAFAIKYRLKCEIEKQTIIDKDFKVILISRGKSILPNHCTSVQKIISRLLLEKDIELILSTEIIDLNINSFHGKKILKSIDGREFLCDEVIWCTQACGQKWKQDNSSSNLSYDDDGFILINSTLQSITCPNIFAVGDICHNVTHPRAKAGVFAVRAGPPLLQNIRHYLAKEPLEEW